MLKVVDLKVRYGTIEAVKGMTLEVHQGEIVCLIGPNGAGKTTTLMAISGLLRPSSGTIHFLGRDITREAPERIVKLGLVQVPEHRWILGQMTVKENLLMGAYIRDERRTIEEDFEGVVRRFPILGQRLQQKAATLSGGEQQMLAIARALMARPKLLMMDEPSLGLGPLIVEEVFRIIDELHREGTTILLVEQNARMALACANRGYVMEAGQIVLADRARNLMQDASVRKAYLGG